MTYSFSPHKLSVGKVRKIYFFFYIILIIFVGMYISLFSANNKILITNVLFSSQAIFLPQTCAT